MAALDPESQRIVVHVVYDGPAMSGKTTNVKQLMGAFTDRRRSDMYSPGSDGERTKFLDWLKVDTGLVSGRRLSCHFITVPGQRVLARRRNLLLGLADVVVFVCPADAESQNEVDASYRSLQARLSKMEQRPPLVVQLNKTDLPGAISPQALRTRLQIPDEVAVLAAQASADIGVKETAVLAIRDAADRVQDHIIVHGIDSLPTEVPTADELHHKIIEHEQEDGRSPLEVILDAESLAPPPVEEPKEKRNTNPAPSFVAQPAENLRWSRIAELPIEDIQPAQPVENTSSGMIWPANQGRDYMRRALYPKRDHVRICDGVLEHQAGPWYLSTCPKQVYASSDDAKGQLLRRARTSIQLGSLCVPRLVWCVARSEEGAWLWRVSQDPASVYDHLGYAVRTGNERRTLEILGYFVDALFGLYSLRAQPEGTIACGLSDLAVLGPSARFLLALSPAVVTDSASALAQVVTQFPLPEGVRDVYFSSIREKFGEAMLGSIDAVIGTFRLQEPRQSKLRSGRLSVQSAARTGTDSDH